MHPQAPTVLGFEAFSLLAIAEAIFQVIWRLIPLVR
jgi:hypothetical protein